MENMSANINPTVSTCIGLVSGSLTTLSFLPQVLTLCKVRTTADIHSLSLSMYVIYSIGTLMWIVYGMLMEDFMVVFFNMLGTLLVWYCIIKIVVLRHCESAYEENTEEDITDLESNRELERW